MKHIASGKEHFQAHAKRNDRREITAAASRRSRLHNATARDERESRARADQDGAFLPLVKIDDRSAEMFPVATKILNSSEGLFPCF